MVCIIKRVRYVSTIVFFFVPLDLQCMILLYYRDMITTEAHLMTTGPRGMRVCLMDTPAVLHLLTGTIITALRSTPFLRMKGIEISVLVYQKTHKLIGNLWIYISKLSTDLTDSYKYDGMPNK